MKLTILLIGLATIINGSLSEPCNGIVIDGILQKSEVLKSNVPNPYQLAVDRDTNTLFFSYTASDDDEIFKTVYVNLKDNTSGTITGAPGSFANAVDHQKQIVYIGAREGIYKYDYNTKTAVKLNFTYENIWQLFFKDALYFTTYPDEKAYIYKNGVVRLVPELKDHRVMLMALDKNNNIFFAQGGELKKVVNGEIIEVGDYSVNGFNTDVNGELYFSTPDGIYRLVNGKVEKVTSINNVYGFAIAADNTIVYGGESTVVHLEPTSVVCDEVISYQIKFD